MTDLTLNGVQHSRWLPLVQKHCLANPMRFHLVWGIQILWG